jgi:aminoglycoside phosphotransferase family enzyme
MLQDQKPIRFSFLDFSTQDKRKHYCEREVTLNKRLAKQLYIKVVPVFKKGGHFSLTGRSADLLDHAVLMHRMDTNREMDHLLETGQVSFSAVKKLARQIAAFHQQTVIVREPFDLEGLQQRFADIRAVQETLDVYFSGAAKLTGRLSGYPAVFLKNTAHCWKNGQTAALSGTCTATCIRVISF